MRYSAMIAKIQEQSKEAGVKVEEFVKVAAIMEKHQLEETAARSSTKEERDKLQEFLEGLDGGILDLERVSFADICKQAGIRVNQGTTNAARRKVNKLLGQLEVAAHRTQLEKEKTDQAKYRVNRKRMALRARKKSSR